jgi:hypothetical protein
MTKLEELEVALSASSAGHCGVLAASYTDYNVVLAAAWEAYQEKLKKQKELTK